MKYYIFLSLFLMAVSGYAQKEKAGYTINGKINGDSSGMIYLSQFIINGKRDSAKISNGKFSFRGVVQEAVPCILSLKRNFVNEDLLMLFIENNTIAIEINGNDISNAKVTGTGATGDYVVLEDLTKSLDAGRKKLFDLMNQYSKDKSQKQQEDSVRKVLGTMEAETQTIRKTFIESHPSSAVSAWLTSRYFRFGTELSVTEKMYAGFDAKVLKTSYAKEVKQHIDVMKRTSVGQMAMDFTQNDTLDRPVSLKDFRGKYVLLDFWASWCKPCRMENPNVVAAYNKYKDKNFTVLSVSLDRENNKQNWLDAIRKDGLTWTHVSDLKFWDNAVGKLYGVLAVPTNFLIDPSGIIIAKDLEGEGFGKKLEEVLK